MDELIKLHERGGRSDGAYAVVETILDYQDELVNQLKNTPYSESEQRIIIGNKIEAIKEVFELALNTATSIND